MGTVYVTGSPCTLKKFIKIAKENGWNEGTADNGKFALTDGENYAHGLEETKLKGKTYVMFDQWGRNDLSELAEAVGAICEHDEEFDELMGIEEEE